jgi:hypothetical protein
VQIVNAVVTVAENVAVIGTKGHGAVHMSAYRIEGSDFPLRRANYEAWLTVKIERRGPLAAGIGLELVDPVRGHGLQRTRVCLRSGTQEPRHGIQQDPYGCCHEHLHARE